MYQIKKREPRLDGAPCLTGCLPFMQSRKLPPVSVKLDDSLFIESLDNPKPVITLAELSTHTLATDCWIAIDGRVFDVTKWLTCHPGGAMCLMSVAGRDVTDIFHSLHPVLVQKQMRHIWVGVLPSEEVKPSQLLKDYRQLYQDMIDAGMFVTDPGFYVWLGLRVASLLVASICCVLLGSSAWIRVGLGAPLLAAFWQQLAFVGHDMGHSAITHNRRLDHRIGVYLGNALGGISIGWWKDSHFFHHVVTNSVSHDPDIQHAPFMAVDATFLPGQHNDGKPLWSFYHSRFMHFGGVIAGFLIRNQATLFYPLLMVARFFLYIQSFLFTLGLGEFDPNAAPGRRRAGISHRRIEIFTLLVSSCLPFFASCGCIAC
jgi:cytochrome b involved in lipid metabolism